MRILLAVDGSASSETAVKEVARRPWPPRSAVRIISVVEPAFLPNPETWTLPPNYYEQLEKAAKKQAGAVLNKAMRRLGAIKGTRLQLSKQILHGHPKQVIPEEAERWRADLIVVGSHGYRGLTRLWLGSVSHAVASHAKCSVEIVRGREVES